MTHPVHRSGHGHPGQAGHPGADELDMPASRMDFDQRPILVFWESTRACLLACKHCRASAIETALPGELATQEAKRLIDSLADFGRPSPVLIVTGGDALMRSDLFELVGYARGRGMPVGISPSVTPRLTAEAAIGLRTLGVKAASISLDGATAQTHEGVRGVPGLFDKTIETLRLFATLGYTIQVNTTVMRENVRELASIVGLMRDCGVKIWEVFFLIQVGRGNDMRALDPREHEDVVQFLYEVSRHGITVRTVEAPFFRRVCAWRQADAPGNDPRVKYGLSPLYQHLSRELARLLGPPSSDPMIRSARTRDGKGIIFVGYDGEIYPAGFLPVSLGNVRRDSLVDVYRNHPLLQSIREARFSGRCGVCEFADLCGGSRSRAYATSGDALGEDAACAYIPALTRAVSPTLVTSA